MRISVGFSSSLLRREDSLGSCISDMKTKTFLKGSFQVE